MSNSEWCMDKLPIGHEMMVRSEDLTIEISRMPEDEERSLLLYGNLNAYFYDGSDDNGDFESRKIGVIKAGIFDLHKYDSPFDLETGVFSSHGEVDALRPLFHDRESIMDTAKLNKPRIKGLGGKANKPRVMYIDLIYTHQQIASRNFGFLLCVEFCRLVFDIFGRLPVMSYLGAYDNSLDGSLVVRYLERQGFAKVERGSWHLPFETIQYSPCLWDQELRVRERGRKSNKHD